MHSRGIFIYLIVFLLLLTGGVSVLSLLNLALCCAVVDLCFESLRQRDLIPRSGTAWPDLSYPHSFGWFGVKESGAVFSAL